MKYKNYVGTFYTNENGDTCVMFVTKVNNSDKTFLRNAGEPAKEFPKSYAEDLVYGMVCNGYTAAVIRVPEFYEFKNPEKRKED